MMSRPQRGFTLLEMIVVLAVVALLAAMTLPAMFRPLGKADLRVAAEQVQAALLEARMRAVEYGVVQEFRYQPGGRRYEIVARSEEDDGGRSAAMSSGTAESPSHPAGFAVSERFGDVLPDGIVFVAPQEETHGERPAPFSKPNVAATNESDSAEQWAPPLRFYPNGRGVNCRLKLRNSQSWSIEILLRGLIGSAIIGEPGREQTDQEPLAHAS